MDVVPIDELYIFFSCTNAGGYANEVGESFRYQYPRLVLPSYAIAFGYCFADAAYESYQVMAEDNSKTIKETRSKEVRAAIAGFDTLLWQGE